MIATFVTKQRSNINANSSDVTPEQIGKCFKVYDEQTHKWFYQVENSQGALNEDNELAMYRVDWSKEQGFTCSCPSGQHGFANVRHASGVCWHVRASVAASREEHVATATAEREHTLLIDNKPVAQEQYEAIVTAPVKKSHGNAKSYQPRAFSLFK